MRVMKFGGTSVGDAARLRHVADLIAHQRAAHPQLVVVVSAMAGVTDALIRMSQQAREGNPEWRQTLADLRERHREAVDELGLPEEEARALREELEQGFARAEQLAQAVAALRELSPSIADLLAGMGRALERPHAGGGPAGPGHPRPRGRRGCLPDHR